MVIFGVLEGEFIFSFILEFFGFLFLIFEKLLVKICIIEIEFFIL